MILSGDNNWFLGVKNIFLCIKHRYTYSYRYVLLKSYGERRQLGFLKA